jgi:hypothetical protein
MNLPYGMLLIFDFLQHINWRNVPWLAAVKKTLPTLLAPAKCRGTNTRWADCRTPVFFLADTIALDIDKELNIIDIIDIRPASSINLQKLIAAGVVTINPATAPKSI